MDRDLWVPVDESTGLAIVGRGQRSGAPRSADVRTGTSSMRRRHIHRLSPPQKRLETLSRSKGTSPSLTPAAP